VHGSLNICTSVEAARNNSTVLIASNGSSGLHISAKRLQMCLEEVDASGDSGKQPASVFFSSSILGEHGGEKVD